MIGRNNFFFLRLLVRVRVFLLTFEDTVFLFTLNEPSVFTYRLEKRFIQEGIELRTSFMTLNG